MDTQLSNNDPFSPNGNRLFRMPDGKIIYATSKEELALKIRESSFFPAKDLNEYMFEFAKRVFIMHGVRVCAWNPELFISDLLYYKIITEILVN